ncbi:transmembrane protein [Ceratobasidium sp. AG-Ba]|nr:transmembrane protein [Ceratobasidium sp. AG-Ba]
MSQVMLPKSQNAIPKTHAERVQAEPRIEQAPGSIRVQVEDPEDPPGEEMTKAARVWKTYVREADQWDKEMVEGRNRSVTSALELVHESQYSLLGRSSLDVLLIFAALFSAISTAFIIESLGDLKPDTAESSARSLLAISQKLDAIATGQQSTSISAQEKSLDDFSPTHSAVVVNILWLLSLSLSVAVSLIAMLAKEWCYKFMTGRSGPAYNQARRRQQKWNGIERWKMQELVNALPGLLHAALLLFAAGLCIYLRDIHSGVAIVVTVVTVVAGCIYALTTVLPLFDRFCPYSTPATPILAPIISLLRHVVYLAVNYEYNRTGHTNWLESSLEYLTGVLAPNQGNDDSEGKEDIYAPMDTVTSQMIVWMIVNCEDSRSVHIAYQAISGARPTLPLATLQELQTPHIICQYVRSLVQQNAESRQCSLRDPNMLRTALRYCRAASVLTRVECYTNPYARGDYGDIIRIHTSLLATLEDGATDSTVETATDAAACLNYMRRSWRERPSDPRLKRILFEPTKRRASTILNKYASSNTPSLPLPAILMLVESYAYYMAENCSTMQKPERSSIIVDLTRICVQSDDTNRPIAQVACFALVAASFEINPYPGGDRPPAFPGAMAERAVQVLRNYLNSPDRWILDPVFAFGLIGLFPHTDLNILYSHPSIMSEVYDTLQSRVLLPLYCPFSVPESYSWAAHLAASSSMSQPQITEVLQLEGVASETVALHVLLIQVGFVHHRLLVPVLTMLRRAQTKELQDACIRTLASVPIGRDWLQVKDTLKDERMLRNLLDPSCFANNDIVPAVVFFFRLLVANVMLCKDCKIAQRQSAFMFLLRATDKYGDMKPTTLDKALPSEERILKHTAESTDGKSEPDCMRNTLQLVLDFCQAESSEIADTEQEPVDSDERLSWVAKLEEIKNAFTSSRSRIDLEKSASNRNSAKATEGNRNENQAEQGGTHLSNQVVEDPEKGTG